MDTSILLIDSDLGLLFWLGRILDHAGYQAFPARSVHVCNHQALLDLASAAFE